MKLNFQTDAKSADYVSNVVKAMSEGFNISLQSALDVVNSNWKGINFVGTEHIYYHESPEYFANDLYLGHSSYWWLDEKDRQAKGLGKLKSKPIPNSW